MKRNVIVFLTDEQRHDVMGKYGNPVGLTPNFDAFAEEGTLCRQAFSPQPICTPARACLQTGSYATRNGCYLLGIPLCNRPNVSLADHFNAAGYRTGYIGKWHLADQDIVPEDQRGGYRDWLGSNLLEYSADAYDLVMYDGEGRPARIPGYRVDGVTDCAIRYIDQNKDEPFFLFISLLEPHCQNHSFSYSAPKDTENMYQGKWMPPDLAALGGTSARHMAGYMAVVKRIDEAFGRVMDALRSLKLYDDTIVLFTTDHAEHFNTRNSANKMSPHESSIRIPMAFHGGCFSTGRVINQLVSLIDVAPTLLEAAGLPVPEGMDGRSLVPLLTHPEAPWPQEVLVQISQTQVGRALRTHKWKYCVQAPDKDPFKDMRSDSYVETELYDMEYDPYELQNLMHFSRFDNVKAELRERLRAKIAESGEPMPAIIPAQNEPQPMGILPQMYDPTADRIRDIGNGRRYGPPPIERLEQNETVI